MRQCKILRSYKLWKWGISLQSSAAWSTVTEDLKEFSKNGLWFKIAFRSLKKFPQTIKLKCIYVWKKGNDFSFIY